MRYALTIFVITQALCCAALTPDVARIRELYYKAPGDKKAAERLLYETEQAREATPLLQGYKGIAWMLKANFSMNPYYKFSYFNKGRALLDEAIKRDPANVETRFMRFCAQTNTPSILGYKDEIMTDKTMILSSWRSLTDNELKEKIRNYLARSGYCDKNEISALL